MSVADITDCATSGTLSATSPAVRSLVYFWKILYSNITIVYKEATRVALKADLVTNYLGYWTDNGAYHYYNTLTTNTTYEETLVAVAAGLAEAGVPVLTLLTSCISSEYPRLLI